MANSYNELFGLGSHSANAALRAWLKLQETAGTTAADETANNNDGTINGMGANPSVAAGPTAWLPSAFAFDGSDDSVQVLDAASLDVAGITIAGRFYVSSTATQQVLLSKYSGGSNQRSFFLRLLAGGKLEWGYSSDGTASTYGAYQTLSPVVTAGGWHTLAVSHSSAGTVAVYVDGSSVSIDFGGVAASSLHQGTADLYVAANASLGSNLSGRVADLVVFSGGLTAAEAANMEAGPEPLNTVAPTISGTTAVGSTLTCSTGTWDSQDNGTISYSYQWTRDGSDISGATSSTYATTQDDLGCEIGCRVRAANDGGADAAEDTDSSNTITATVSPEVASVLGGYSSQKSSVVTSSVAEPDYVHEFTLHTTTGTDDAENVYIGNVDVDNLRFTNDARTRFLPFAVLASSGTSHKVAVNLPLAVGDNTLRLYYGRTSAAGDTYKVAWLTDAHYDTLTTQYDRDQSVAFIGNFVARMSSYQPDLAVHSGDKTGATSSNEATQLSWYQSVLDAFANVSAHATTVRDGVAPGNHDFEHMQFSSVLAKHSGETWMEAGVLYGYWESDDYRFISLDAQYSEADDSHLSLQHVGNGWIDQAQIDWLESVLTSSAKPCVVFCHQPLGEFDVSPFGITKETFHTKNRTAVRTVLEDSGKVIAVIHGHVHLYRTDVINGIPYLIGGNLTNDDVYGEYPQSADGVEGNWSLYEFDKVNRTILCRREAYISGSPTTVYEDLIGWGPTTLTVDIPASPERVYDPTGNTAIRAAVFRDPTQSVTNDDDFLRKYPANIQQADPRLSDKTIHYEALTSNPDYGRDVWSFNEFTGLIRVQFSARTAGCPARIKFGASTVSLSPSAYVRFDSGTGQIIAYDTSASEQSLQAYSDGTWYEFRVDIDLDSETYSVWIDGVQKALDYQFYASNTTNISTMEVVTEAGDAYIANLRVSQIPSAEPTADAWTLVDDTAPTLSSAVVAGGGQSIVLTYTEAGSPPLLPATGITGYSVTVDGDAVTVAASKTGDLEHTLTLSYATITRGQAVLVSYTGGNVTDSADPANSLANYSDTAATNNSEITPGGPTAAEIAAQVRTELAVELARLDAAVTTRATADDVPAAEDTADAVRTELATELAHLDTDLSDLATAAALAAVAAKTALISSGSVTITSPVAADGTTITVVQGDSYNNTDDRAITWTGTDADQWPDLTGATLEFTATMKGAADITAVPTVVTPTGTQVFRMELATTDTDVTIGRYRYDVQATLSSGRIITLLRGQFLVERTHTDAP